MKSNLINKSKKLTYKKPTIKKLQISRLSIENNTKIKKIQNKRKTEYNISSYNNSPSKNTFTEANHSKNIKNMKIIFLNKLEKFTKNNLKEKQKNSYQNININKIINRKEIRSLKTSYKKNLKNIDISHISNSNSKRNSSNQKFNELFTLNNIKKNLLDSGITKINISNTMNCSK